MLSDALQRMTGIGGESQNTLGALVRTASPSGLRSPSGCHEGTDGKLLVDGNRRIAHILAAQKWTLALLASRSSRPLRRRTS